MSKHKTMYEENIRTASNFDTLVGGHNAALGGLTSAKREPEIQREISILDSEIETVAMQVQKLMDMLAPILRSDDELENAKDAVERGVSTEVGGRIKNLSEKTIRTSNKLRYLIERIEL